MSLRAQKKAAQREQILTTCKDLFRTKGFDQTTIPDIINRLGISRQTFFNYFPSKNAVLTELGLIWLSEQANIPGIDTRSAREETILTGTRRFILSQMDAIEADAEFMRLVFTRSGLLFPTHDNTTPETTATGNYRDHTRPILNGIAMVIKAAQESGEVRKDIKPLQIAEMYVSLMLMTIRFWLINYWQDDTDLKEKANTALDVLEAGLKAQVESQQ